MSIEKRLPDLAKKGGAHAIGYGDAVPLAVIGEAIEQADADMFVTFVITGDPEKTDLGPMLSNSISIFDAGHFPSHLDGDLTSGGLAAYGTKTNFGYAPTETSFLLSLDAEEQPLPSGTPALIWRITKEQGLDGSTASFVTLDGDTYSSVLSPQDYAFEFAVAPPAEWPEPVVNRAVGRKGVRHQELSADDEAFERCAEQAWARAKKRLAQSDPDGELRITGALVRKPCAKQILAWEKTVAKLLDARILERTRLYDKAKARVTALRR